MITIHKYHLGHGIKIPDNNKLLKVSIDPKDNSYYVWALINTDQKRMRIYSFVVFTTGQQMDYYINSGYLWFDTVIEPDGYVSHIFYKDFGIYYETISNLCSKF